MLFKTFSNSPDFDNGGGFSGVRLCRRCDGNARGDEGATR